MKQAFSAIVLLSALSISCSTHRSQIAPIYSDFRADIAKNKGVPHDVEAIQRQNARAAKVTQLYEAGGLKTAQDYFQAALVLVETDDIAVLKLSETLAMKSAEMGDEHAKRVAAEAIDKQLVRLGLAQRYGTQYIYEPILRGWRLYSYDLSTTDEQRAEMGVPPLAELIAGEAILNQRGKPKM